MALDLDDNGKDGESPEVDPDFLGDDEEDEENPPKPDQPKAAEEDERPPHEEHEEPEAPVNERELSGLSRLNGGTFGFEPTEPEQADYDKPNTAMILVAQAYCDRVEDAPVEELEGIIQEIIEHRDRTENPEVRQLYQSAIDRAASRIRRSLPPPAAPAPVLPLPNAARAGGRSRDDDPTIPRLRVVSPPPPPEMKAASQPPYRTDSPAQEIPPPPLVPSPVRQVPPPAGGDFTPVAEDVDFTPVADDGDFTPVADDGDFTPVADDGDFTPVLPLAPTVEADDPVPNGLPDIRATLKALRSNSTPETRAMAWFAFLVSPEQLRLILRGEGENLLVGVPLSSARAFLDFLETFRDMTGTKTTYGHSVVQGHILAIEKRERARRLEEEEKEKEREKEEEAKQERIRELERELERARGYGQTLPGGVLPATPILPNGTAPQAKEPQPAYLWGDRLRQSLSEREGIAVGVVLTILVIMLLILALRSI
jgi:hypothetical protein